MDYRIEVSVALLLAVLVADSGLAGTYQEVDQGDLSNSGINPTEIPLVSGSNLLYGAAGKVTAMDRDYFTLTVPAGSVLESIELLPGTTVGGGATFLGLQAGKQVTVSANAATAAGLLGWTHYSQADIGKNLLTAMAIPSNGSTGFTPPLPGGDYSIWLQDFGPGAVTYGLDLKIASVPEPATSVGLCLGGVCGLSRVLRQRRRC